MFFVGHTRFSLYLPTSGAWGATRRAISTADYRNYLFSENRLQPRAEMFLERSLPQIDLAIRGHSVKHIVSFSDVLPGAYKDMLIDASQVYPWLVLDEYVDGQGVYNADRVASGMMRDHGCTKGIFGRYRLDDDDLLPVDYFDRMAAHMHEATVGMYVSFGMGFTAIQSGDRFWQARKVLQRMFSAGLLGVCRLNSDSSITRPLNYLSHHLADERSPVIVDSRSPGFFWNRSTLQDTNFSLSHVGVDRLNGELARLPEISSVEEVVRLFPVLTDLIELGPAVEAVRR